MPLDGSVKGAAAQVRDLNRKACVDSVNTLVSRAPHPADLAPAGQVDGLPCTIDGEVQGVLGSAEVVKERSIRTVVVNPTTSGVVFPACDIGGNQRGALPIPAGINAMNITSGQLLPAKGGRRRHLDQAVVPGGNVKSVAVVDGEVDHFSGNTHHRQHGLSVGREVDHGTAARCGGPRFAHHGGDDSAWVGTADIRRQNDAAVRKDPGPAHRVGVPGVAKLRTGADTEFRACADEDLPGGLGGTAVVIRHGKRGGVDTVHCVGVLENPRRTDLSVTKIPCIGNNGATVRIEGGPGIKIHHKGWNPRSRGCLDDRDRGSIGDVHGLGSAVLDPKAVRHRQGDVIDAGRGKCVTGGDAAAGGAIAEVPAIAGDRRVIHRGGGIKGNSQRAHPVGRRSLEGCDRGAVGVRIDFKEVQELPVGCVGDADVKVTIEQVDGDHVLVKVRRKEGIEVGQQRIVENDRIVGTGGGIAPHDKAYVVLPIGQVDGPAVVLGEIVEIDSSVVALVGRKGAVEFTCIPLAGSLPSITVAVATVGKGSPVVGQVSGDRKDVGRLEIDPHHGGFLLPRQYGNRAESAAGHAIVVDHP